MAVIRQYDADPANYQVPSGGESALMRAGVHVRGAYEAAGNMQREGLREAGHSIQGLADEADKYLSVSEITGGAADLGALRDSKNRQVNEYLVNNPDVGKDPDAFNKIMQNIVTPGYGQFVEGMQTKRGKEWAQGQVARSIEGHATQVAHGIATTAADGLSTDLGRIAISATNLIARDPSQLSNEIAHFDDTFNSMMKSMAITPELKAHFDAMREAKHKELEHSAIQSLMVNNPAGLDRAIASGMFKSTDGGTLEMAKKTAYALAKQRSNEDRAAQNFARMEKDREWTGRFFGPEGGTFNEATGQFIVKPGFIQDALMKSGTRDGPGGETVRMMLSYAAKPDDVKSAPGMLHKVLTGLMDGTMDTHQVVDMIGTSGGISKQDAGFALGITGENSASQLLMRQTLAEAKSQLAPSKNLFGNPDPTGAHQLTKFTGWLTDQLKMGRAQGLTTQQMLSPNSENYILKGKTWKDPAFVAQPGELIDNALSPLLKAGAAAAAAPVGSFAARIQKLGERSSPWDVSVKGAEGEMQVMPDTAASPGFGVRPENPNVPGDKERLGRDYADALLKHYDGNEAFAAAAYNAGAGRVRDWVAANGTPDPKDPIAMARWVAAIPFKETRDYVKRVTGIGTPPPPTAKQVLNFWAE